MALFCSPPAAPPPVRIHADRLLGRSFPCPNYPLLGRMPRPLAVFFYPASVTELGPIRKRRGCCGFRCTASHVCDHQPLTFDRSSLALKEAGSDDELLAAVRLRVRTFYQFRESYGVEDLRRSLVEREFEVLKDRIAGKNIGFRRVTCINATLPLSPSFSSSSGLCSVCKFSQDGEDRVVVGTLDINQCHSLPDELTGKRPQVLGAILTRAYLSNVCVAAELQRNGLGYLLLAKSKIVARIWGITDLYVHVAVDNAAAQSLYKKSGFVYENDEPAWQARFLGRPRRYLLWADLRKVAL